MTPASLKSRTVKDLAQMARSRGLRGWHSMRKDQLVRALLRSVRKNHSQRNGANGNGQKSQADYAVSGGSTATEALKNGSRPPTKKRGLAMRRLEAFRQQQQLWKDLSARASEGGGTLDRDRLVVMVRDAFWLHAYWEITRQSVERAQAAMGQYWHAAIPVLRVFELDEGVGMEAERLAGDIEIHGGVNNWYVDVIESPKSYRLDIGYLAPPDRYYSLARSNAVTTPSPCDGNPLDQNWAAVAEDPDRIYALSKRNSSNGVSKELHDLLEERLRRPMGEPGFARFGPGADLLADRHRDFEVHVDAELIVFGSTEPNAHVTLLGKPIRLRPDGTFTMRLSLPERRQVIPVVASSADGAEQRTVVLAVERNTKHMEPVIRESHE